MSEILAQLGLDETFLIQLGVFAIVFLILGNVYFKPFLKLFQIRHERTIKDKEAAEKLTLQAQQKLEDYKNQLSVQKQETMKDFDRVIAEAEAREAEIVAKAWEEAKRITHTTAEKINIERESIRKQIEADIDQLAKQISEKMLSRKG